MFSGCSIYLYGLESGIKKKITNAIKQNGGQVSSILGLKTTHLVTTPDKVAEMAYSIKKAQQHNTTIVSADWILHSVDGRKRLDEKKYLLTDGVSADTGISTQSPNTRKEKLMPVVSSVLPPSARQNNLQLCIIGRNFTLSGVDMKVKIGSLEIGEENISVHSSTVLVVSVPDFPKFPQGNIWVQVSSDGGDSYSAGSNFTIVTTELSSSGTFSFDSHENSREIKIFLSSPFRDMQMERDWIVKWAIPKLKKYCSDRDVVLSYVDLRWGVTDVQSAKATSLLMCLRELFRSNVFVGSYGQRYGWSVSSAPMQEENNQLLARTFDMAEAEYPWITKYRDRSITEVEMRAILDNVVRIPAFFYFRDIKFVDTQPPYDRHKYISEGTEETTKLDLLKKDIRNSKFGVIDYIDPQIMAEKMYEEISALINNKYPEQTNLDTSQGESAAHETYSRSLARVYSANQKYFFILDKHVANEEAPLVVTGESGVGKSALLANWSHRFRSHHPEDLVITHFVGSTASSTNFASMISRIMEEIRKKLGKSVSDLSIPSSSTQLVQEFPLWLSKATSVAGGRRTILVLDGLDKLDDVDNALDLLWLPREFPQNLRVILSTVPGRTLQAITKRDHKILKLDPLPEWERVSFIRTYLNWHSKKLSELQEFRMAAAGQMANPLYAKVFMDDISVLGEYEKLDEHIDSNLKAKTACSLYQIVIGRLISDYDRKNTGVVETFMSLLWAARRGLSEMEIEKMMLAQGHSTKDWHPIFLAMEGMLLNCSGLLNFSDKEFKEAVKKTFLVNEKKVTFAHEAIANFFAVQEGYPIRKVEELPFQIANLKDPKRLRECLTDLELFRHLYEHPENKFVLIKWWGDLEKHGFDVVKAYSSVLDFYEKDQYYQKGKDSIEFTPFYTVGFFLEEMAKMEGSEEIYKRALSFAKQPRDKALVMNALSRLYETQARFDLAESILRQSLVINEQNDGKLSLNTSNTLTRLGAVLVHTGKLDEADEILLKSLKIREDALGKNHSRVGQTLKHLLTVRQMQGDYKGAEEFGIRALKITEDACGPYDFHVSSILLKIGVLYNELGRHKESEDCFARALDIRKHKFGDDHPFTADVLREIASVYEKQEKFSEALPYYIQAMDIKQKSLGKYHPDIAQIQNRLAAIYTQQKKYKEAEKLILEALKIREQLLGPNHSRVGQTLKHMLTLYEEMGEYQKAADCGYRALANTKNAFGEDHFHVSSILLRLGILECSLHKFSDAQKSFEQALQIRRKKFGNNHSYVADVMQSMGDMFVKLNKIDDAKNTWETTLKIRENVCGRDAGPTKQTKASLKSIGIL